MTKITKMIKEAIKDEKAGNTFYKDMASKLRTPKDKKMVQNIASQEAKHRIKMKTLLKKCSSNK